MSKTELIDLPAAHATKTSLVIDDRATDKQLLELGHALAQIEGSRAWWLGDYGLALRARKMAELKALNPGKPEEELHTKGHAYLLEKAEQLGIDPALWSECIVVARYYEKQVRTHISYTHHRTAMQGVGGHKSEPKKAIAWLLQAEEGSWSVSRMRHEMNLALRQAEPPKHTPQENPFAILDDADKWAIGHRNAELTPEAARQLITRWQALINFVDRIKELAAHGG